MNSLNLRQIDGGNIIKQADSGSLFKFELLDENHKKFEEQLGDTATVILKKDTVAVFKKIVAVTDNCVAFNLDKILGAGYYILEIIVGEYVFPSDNRLKISVESTYGDFEPEYLVKVSYEELKADVDDFKIKIEQFENTLNANETNVNQELLVINQNASDLNKRIELLENREDKDTIYDDTEIKRRVSALEERPSSEAYDDTELSNRVTALERKQDNDTIYDDAPIIKRIEKLEAKEDNDTIYDDSELVSRVTALENKPDKDTIYDDSDIKRRLTALESKEDHDTIYDDTKIKQSIANVDNKVSGLSAKVIALEERPIVDTALTERVEALERKEDKDTIYNDTEIKNRLVALEQKEDKDTIYDDSDLKHRVTELENRPVAEPYNDTEIKDRLTVLESKQDKDTVYDDTAIKERISALEDKPDNDTIYDDTNLKAQIVELQEKLKSLNTVRRAPTGYTLDRTTVPWRIIFDNGCILEFPRSSPINERDKANLIYGYGFPANSNSPTAFSAPIPPLIISASRGAFTVDKFKESDEAHFHITYANYRLHHPIRNYDDFNWENAYGNRVNQTVSSNGKSNFTKMMYELGIWSEADVLYLGATKK